MPPLTSSPAAALQFSTTNLPIVIASLLSVTKAIPVKSAPPRTAVTVPERIGFQGYAADGSGVPLDGTYDVLVNVYDAASGGSSLWSHNYTGTGITGGLYSLTLQGPFDPSDFNGDRWIGVTIDGGTEITPRSKVPFALNAQQAQSVDWAGVQAKPAGFGDNVDDDTLAGLSCAGGEIAKRVSGGAACAAHRLCPA